MRRCHPCWPPPLSGACLPLLAASAPGTLTASGVGCLGSAQKLAPQDQLGVSVATRALAAAGGQSGAPLIKVQDLSTEQVRRSRPPDTWRVRPGGCGAEPEINHARTNQYRLSLRARRKTRGSASTLARNFAPLLQKFDLLYEPTLTAVSIAPLPGSASLLLAFLVRPERLSAGCWNAHAPAWSFLLTLERSAPRIFLPIGHGRRAGGLGARHGQRGRAHVPHPAAGLAPWVDVELILLTLASRRSTEQQLTHRPVHRSGDVQSLGRRFVLLALLGSVAWVIVLSFRWRHRGGACSGIRFQGRMFSVSFHAAQEPVIETALQKKLEWLGQRKRASRPGSRAQHDVSGHSRANT